MEENLENQLRGVLHSNWPGLHKAAKLSKDKDAELSQWTDRDGGDGRIVTLSATAVTMQRTGVWV